MITAYGLNDDDISGQRLLGKAIGLLNQHPVLNQAGIEELSPGLDTLQHDERIKIVQELLSVDELSMLWNTFQPAEYRLSITYEVSGVFIESTTSTK